MRWRILAGFVLVAILATSAYAGEKCTGTTQACLNKMAAGAGEKSWLGIEKAKSDEGYTVAKVYPGSPAEKAGFQVGDLLVSINDMAMGSDELKKGYEKVSKPGSTVKYTVMRGGKEMQLKPTLVKMPEEVFAAHVGMHMLEHAETQSAAK